MTIRQTEMALTLTNFESAASALLDCFSIPSNYHYLRTEAGMATVFQQAVSTDNKKNDNFKIIVRANDKTHTLFKLFSNQAHQQYINQNIPQAILWMKLISQRQIDCVFLCDYRSTNFNDEVISIKITFNFKNHSINVINMSADSSSVEDSQLLILPTIISLTIPN